MRRPLPVRLCDGVPDRFRPGPVTLRRVAIASLVILTVIVVSGAAVRLTDSGLGCPTWPRCSDANFTTAPEQGIHGLVEFGNRLLSFLVGVVVVATLLATLLVRPWRRDLTRWTMAVVAGVVAQGVLGGITVLTGLHPLTVAAHFLLSMVLLGAAVVLVRRTRQAPGPARPVVRRELVLLGRALVAVAGAVLVLGTIVTGSGPHSGDPDAQRLDLDPATVSQLHADGVFLLLGLALATVLVLRALGAPPEVRRAGVVLLAVLLAQGAVGYTQYFTGLPEVLVGVHVLGACLVWIAVVHLHLTLFIRLPATAPDPRVPQAVEHLVGK